LTNCFPRLAIADRQTRQISSGRAQTSGEKTLAAGGVVRRQRKRLRNQKKPSTGK
jgi:hypothetical protein